MLAELVRVTTEDGLKHFGALYAARTPQPKPLGVVLIHGMTGSFIGEIESELPPMLAEAGYTTLVVNNRGTGIVGAATEAFEGCIPDIRAAIDLLQARGFERIALFGHSKAGVKTAYYMVKTGDPRVVRLGSLSPASSVHEMPVWVSAQFGKRNPRAWLDKMLRLSARGKGAQFASTADWPYIVSAGTVADHLAVSDDDTHENLLKLNLPILAACGSLETEWCTTVTRLKAKAPANFRVAIIDGADHVYTGRERDLANLMIEWMES